MNRRVTRRIGSVVITSVLLASCGGPEQVAIVSSRPVTSAPSSDAPSSRAGDTEPAEPSTANTVPTTSTTSTTIAGARATVDLADVVDLGDGRSDRPEDALVAAAVLDITEWSAEVLASSYGADDRTISGSIHAGRPDRPTSIPGCGTATTPYRDLVDYVALYCPDGEFVVYDDGPDGLLGDLVAENGGISIGVVLAHEFGHFIQDRAGLLDLNLPTVTTEQQADCFAGSWIGRAARGGSAVIDIGADGIRAGLIALVQVRDPAGVDTLSPGGHGTAFDRVGAFQVGFEGGADACARLVDDPLPLMPNAYLSLDDYLRGGDAPYDCSGVTDSECRPSWEFLGDDLNEFWSLALGEAIDLHAVPVDNIDTVCTGLRRVDGPIARCVDSGIVPFDENEVLRLYTESGDFTLGYLLGLAWADAALAQYGSSVLDDPLTADCLVGAWVDDITLGSRRDSRRASTVTTSPGDPDEAILMLIRLSDTDSRASLFERVAAFRSGVLGGSAACSR